MIAVVCGLATIVAVAAQPLSRLSLKQRDTGDRKFVDENGNE
jgi:hypothetical protein